MRNRPKHSTAKTITTLPQVRWSAGWDRKRAVLFVVRGPQQGALFRLGDGINLAGRDDALAIALTDETVSREHARFLSDGSGVYVEDLASFNGTTVNQRPIEHPTRLEEGDYVGLGNHTIVKFSRMGELEEQTLRTLFELTLRDPLTHLYNRRYLDERLHSEFSYAQRSGAGLGLLLVDIDHFKDVNDTWGHPAGDAVLKAVAACIRNMMRPEDVLSRYGGEEFLIITRGTSDKAAQILAERIRRAIEQLSLPQIAADLRVTVSIGVACLSGDVDCASAQSLIQSADQALYQAKSEGRNRVRGLRLPKTSPRIHERRAPRTLPPPGI